MKQYLVRRVLQMIPLLLGLSVLLFLLFAMAPGDFVDSNASPHMTAARILELKRLLGLDQPLHIRYFTWLGNAVRGNLGDSLQYAKPVTAVINDYVWNSFLLATVAFFIEIIISVPIGVFSATKQYSAFDMIFTVFALVGISIPSFFMGLLLLKLFAIDRHWFPLSGMRTLGTSYVGMQAFWNVAWHLVLPAMVLGLSSVGSMMRYTRTAMLEVIRQDYIRTARAKGLSERTVIYKHGLRNALIPIVTIIGLSLPALFSGAIITEQIFAFPGIGRVAYQAINKRDYPLLMGYNMLMAVLTLAGNLLADVAYAAVDPRVRLK